MRGWDAERVARAAGAELVRSAGARAEPGDPDRVDPTRAAIDSRTIQPGELFVGIPGEHVDGGKFAAAALEAGAWGVLVEPAHADGLPGDGAVLAAGDPVAALGSLAREWRRELGCQVIAITGSTGKTSTKEILAGLLAPHRRTLASRANFNTEIGLPLNVLEAEPGVEAMVLELAMRGPGQIAELAAICEPDVGVVVNIGPVHLELLGSLEAIAEAKAELLAALKPGAAAVVPAGEPLLAPHLREDLETVTFGEGGDVVLDEVDGSHVVVRAQGDRIEFELPFTQAYNRTNLLTAVAAARAIGVQPSGRVEVEFSPLRGERVELPGGTVVIDDCYNANPMSMRAALDELAATAGPSGDAGGRRVAVLGDMLELGEREADFHREIGAYADDRGVDLLVTVGSRAAAIADTFDGEAHSVADAAEAAALLPELLQSRDVVLVKGSRGVGLEVVAEALREQVSA
jgi:UDP-N-acetylmuramoyl-tripeptide--D-alanyl-D-alanine ligase